MKKIKYLLLSISILLLSGCYNYRELNDMALTSALGIDKTEDGYKVIAQVISTKNTEDTNSTTPNFVIYTQNGKTIQEASRKILLESPKRLFINHLELLIISEDLAKEGISDILDLLFRDAESRNQYHVLIAKDYSPEEILSTLTPLETIASSNISKSLISESTSLGITKLITFENLIGDYINSNIELSIPSVTLIDEDKDSDKNSAIETSNPKTKVVLSNTAIFKEDKLIGYLNEDEDIASNFIQDEIEDTLITLECDKDKYITIEITSSKTKIETEKNKLKITYSIKANGTINEVNCNVNLEDSKEIKKIEEAANQKLIENITKTIDKMKYEYNSDVFGFKDIIYRNNYSLYKQVENEWYQKYFSLVEIEVKSNIELKGKGQTLKVIKDE